MEWFKGSVYARMLLLCCWSATAAAGQSDFRAVDRHARRAPAELEQDLPALTAYLVEPAANELEKTRAVYIWITHRIEYDDEAYQNGVGRINRHNADILRRKKAVCFGYALLFQAMCAEAGIDAQVISGYSKGTLTSQPALEEADHAWNAVRIDGRWHLLDATWGASLIDKENDFVRDKEDVYFLTPPDTFALSHLPNLPMWQLLDCPVSAHTFRQSPDTLRQYLASAAPCFAYADSIRSFLALDEPRRRLWEAEGAFRFNPTPANRSHLGHSLLDYAGLRSDAAEALQDQPAPADSLIGIQEEVIGLCRRAFSLTTPYDWQKELYISALLNQAIALYQQADRVDAPTPLLERALRHLDTGEALIGQLPEGGYFAGYARRQCQQVRSAVEAAMKR